MYTKWNQIGYTQELGVSFESNPRCVMRPTYSGNQACLQRDRCAVSGLCVCVNDDLTLNSLGTGAGSMLETHTDSLATVVSVAVLGFFEVGDCVGLNSTV